MIKKEKRKIKFIGDEKFLFGIKELQKQLGFIDGEDYVIDAVKRDGNVLTVESDEKGATIYYPRDDCFFRGFSLAAQYVGERKTVTVKKAIKDVGTMQNCSEAVLTVETLKDVIRQSAVNGMNYVGIYTELTYAVEGEPYIGYKSGAYTTEELKEVVDYAEKFCVEAVPYIQTLSHMNQLFRWPAYGEYKDAENVILTDYEKTYELIEKMIKSLRKAYKTSKINLGMDEAYSVGSGRYRWFINEEYTDPAEIFIRHLKRVINIAEKYGFTDTEIWFDNLFGMKYKGYIYPPEWLFKDVDEKIRSEFPKVKLNLWYYGISDKTEIKRVISNVRQLSEDVSFSTIVHGYSSFAPINSFAERAAEFVREACVDNKIDKVLITNWGIIPPSAFTAGYYKYAETFAETDGYDFCERAEFLYGNTYDELKKTDIPNEVEFDEKKPPLYEYNPPYYIMADDPLLGIMAKNIPSGAGEYYKQCAKELFKAESKRGKIQNVYRFERYLCLALSDKAPLSLTIKERYDEKDLKGLKKSVSEIEKSIKSLQEFHEEFRKFWLENYKSFGLELFDMRFGGMAARMKYIGRTLKTYINGKIDKIEELEENRLPFYPSTEGKITCNAVWNNIAVGRNMRV